MNGPDEMPFLNGGKGGDTRHDSHGDNGPENCRSGYEEQESRQFVGCSMREAETFENNKRRDLIDDLDGGNYPCPNPQPNGNLHNWYQPYCATSDKADVSHAVQQGTGLTLGVQFPRQVSIQHIADAAKTIDDPESHAYWINKQQTDGPGKSERRDYVWNTLQFISTFRNHPSREAFYRRGSTGQISEGPSAPLLHGRNADIPE